MLRKVFKIFSLNVFISARTFSVELGCHYCYTVQANLLPLDHVTVISAFHKQEYLQSLDDVTVISAQPSTMTRHDP